MKREIRQDLKDGMTINDVCTKYQLTFKQLMRLFNGDRYKATTKESISTTGELYISRVGNRYIIRRCKKHYGTYKTLEDAVKVRNHLIFNGWYKNRLNTICKELGVERCTK